MVTLVHYDAEYRDEFYWQRVDRNLGWLGDSAQEAHRRQAQLRDCRIGIAGCGGIGGGVAERLARLGVLTLKIADMDVFEPSNINRQLGAGANSLGANKAETVGAFIHTITPDVDLTVYPEGITKDTVDHFVDGCDYIVDEIEPYAFPARYLLHRTFRGSTDCQFIMTGHVYGNQTFLWRWYRDSLPLEAMLGLPEDAVLTPDTATRLMRSLIPERSHYPIRAMQDTWLINDMTCPIVAGAPVMSQGLIVERIMLAVTGIERQEDSQLFPTAPGYAVMDSRTWTAKFVSRSEADLESTLSTP